MLIKNYLNIPEDFLIYKDIIKNNFEENYINIYKNILKYKDIEKKRINISIYMIKYFINYKELNKNYMDFLQKLNLNLLNI